jgi:hypothetical protein
MHAIVEPVTESEREAPTQRAINARQRWECARGEAYWLSEAGRHRIYWALDAPADHPLLDGFCVRCRRPLRGKQARCSEPS